MCKLLRRCVLCHQEQHADAARHLLSQRQITRTPEGVANRALGPLLLVRVSAISNAWVHMQCALWSGEVGLRNCFSPRPCVTLRCARADDGPESNCC